jgi:hypothetical protein
MATGESIYKIQADMLSILRGTLSNVLLLHSRVLSIGESISEPGIWAGPIDAGIRIDRETHGVECRVTDPVRYSVTQFLGGSRLEGRVFEVILDLWLPEDVGLFDEEPVLLSLEGAGFAVRNDLLRGIPSLTLASNPVYRPRTETARERYLQSFREDLVCL